jgi:predicted nucleic acid binding AN1-type Zn finger protein
MASHPADTKFDSRPEVTSTLKMEEYFFPERWYLTRFYGVANQKITVHKVCIVAKCSCKYYGCAMKRQDRVLSYNSQVII